MVKEYRLRTREQKRVDGTIHKYSYLQKTYYQERPETLDLSSEEKRETVCEINQFLNNLIETYLIPPEDKGLQGLRILLCQVYGLLPKDKLKGILNNFTAQCNGKGGVPYGKMGKHSFNRGF